MSSLFEALRLTDASCLSIKRQEGGEGALAAPWPLRPGPGLQAAATAAPWTGRHHCRLQADRPAEGGRVHTAQRRRG